MFVKTLNGFDIHIKALPEYAPVGDTFDISEKDLKEIIEKIENGQLEYFCAEVTAKKQGITLASDYLGACIYKSLQDFVDNSVYFDDMAESVTKEAAGTIKNLCKEG